MKKFTKVKEVKPEDDKKGEVKYEASAWKAISYKSWEFVDESDSVCVVPVFIKENKILLRMEVVPPYNYRDAADYHLTCISGTVENGEALEDCIRRELKEEAGIVVRDNIKIEIHDSLYKSKTQSSKFHLCILPLSLYEYDEVLATGDGSETESLSKTVSVDIKDINRLFPSDVVTRLLLNDVKKYMNL